MRFESFFFHKRNPRSSREGKIKAVIFSDIHGNLHAFEELKKQISLVSPDKVIFLGDAVDYCAFPNECVDGVAEISDIKLLGNHDAAVLGKISDEYFNPEARKSLDWTRKVLSSEKLETLSSWVMKEEEASDGWRIACSHSSYSSPEKWTYILDTEDALDEIKKTKENNFDIIFIGHTHIPMVFFQNDKIKSLHPGEETELDLDRNNRYIINVGSAGQPRDENKMPGFVVFDSSSGKIVFKRFEYDYMSAFEAVSKSGLPKSLALRLLVGR